jgi:hypothetical protein
MQTIMNMNADIYVQEASQTSGSGKIIREWVYDRTVQCKIEPVKTKGSSSKSDNKSFDNGKFDEYTEHLQLKMKMLEQVSKRWRVSGIRSNDNKQVYYEFDKIDQPDTIFDITASHAVLDPFGRVAYYEVTLQRAQVQNDNTKV